MCNLDATTDGCQEEEPTDVHIVDVATFVLKLRHDEIYLGPLPEDRPPEPDGGYRVRPPWRSLYSDRFETLLVRITDDSGTVGWGEALAPVGPEIAAEAIRRLLAPQLVGVDASAPRPQWSRLRDLMRERGHLVGHQADALAAVDIALWDLVGRRTGLPVADLLGGAYRRRVPTYVSGLPRPDDAARAELAKQWQDRGARLIKLHLGHGVETDLATVDAVRTAAPRVSVAVDAHWAYRLPEATRLGRELTARGVAFLEAPLAPEDIQGHRRLADRLDIPVAIGETLRNRYEFTQWLDAGAVGLAQPDVGRTGLTEAWSIAELAAARHVPVAPHHSVGLGVALAAGLHLAAAIEDCPYFEYQPTTVDVANRILRRPLQIGPAGMELPDAPGLGVDVDSDSVEKLASLGDA